MPVAATDYLDLIAHLPVGAVLRFDDVPWEEYEQYNIERNPPPDIVVETELTSASLDKFPIYAALGVPEIWRERKKVVRFYVLGGASYVEVSNSRAFPFLDSLSLSEFLAIGLAEGSRKAARSFRAWVREHRPGA